MVRLVSYANEIGHSLGERHGFLELAIENKDATMTGPRSLVHPVLLPSERQLVALDPRQGVHTSTESSQTLTVI